MTFAINRRLLGEGLVVTDAEAAEAVRFAFEVLKLVLEPGGAVALAAVLSGKIDDEGPRHRRHRLGRQLRCRRLYARILRRRDLRLRTPWPARPPAARRSVRPACGG